MSSALTVSVGGTGTSPRTSKGEARNSRSGTLSRNNGHEARRRSQRALGIDAAFKAVRRFAAQPVSLGGSRDRHRIKEGCLEQDVGGVLGHAAVVATHDAR